MFSTGSLLHCLHVPTRPEMFMLDPFSAVSAPSFAVKYLLSDAEYDGGMLECQDHPRSERECKRSTIKACARSGHDSVSQSHQAALFLGRLSSPLLF
jgi:hypothetical protein